MKTITRKTLEEVLKASNCASDDRTRYDLNSVRLQLSWLGDSVPGNAKIEATDGHCLIRTEIENACEGFGEFEVVEIYFNKEEIQKLKLFLKSEADLLKEYIYSYDKTEKTHKISGNHILIFKSDHADINWPDCEPMIPKKMPNAKFISFNPKLLNKLFKATANKNDFVVTLGFDDAASPMRVFVNEKEGCKYSAVLMPCRIEDSFERDIRERLNAPRSERV